MSGAAGSSQWMYSSGGDYELEQSLRFNDPDSPELEKTFGTATNRKKWTWSGWYKVSLGHGNDSNPIVVTENGQAQNTLITFGGHNAADDTLSVIDWSSTAEKFQLVTTSLFRDPSAWYNIVVAYDSTQSTSSNRLKIYVNGEQVTVFTYSVYPPLNYESYLNSAVATQIGHNESRSANFHGYMAETNFIDGQQLTSTDFGETGTYGEWKPIEYEGTYGTNGFYLNFAGGGVMSATGGNSTATDGDYKAASFTSSGTFTPSADGYVEYLVIAGGGSGGGGPSRYGSGGGAGGYRTGFLPVTGSTGYTVTVGAGGEHGSVTSDVADKGDDSVFGSITSTGGGRGTTTGSGNNNYTTDINGGSGGGAGTYGQGSAGTGISGQGNNGGAGSSNAASGGGGGAGGVGGTAEAAGSEIGGLGGAGLASSITGSSVTRAGGGGGGGWLGTGHAGSAGGSGGGGRGNGHGNAGTDGTANTGSGGGGGGYGHNGGDGGSGIVIIRYKFQ